MDRIVSLAPSATATIRALGAGDRLVGVTAHCDADAPAIGGWLTPDPDRLAALDPDVVLTVDALQTDVRDELVDRGYRVFHHEPTTLEETFDGFAAIGEAIGRPAAGEALARGARERVARHREDEPTDRPTVYCEEWHDPPMAAGNWVPEVVRAAGGRYPFRDPGERSGAVDGDAVAAAAPDHVFVHHCGRGEAADPDFEARGWTLDAEVHVLDDALLNQPSPRLLDGVDLLAATIHGHR